MDVSRFCSSDTSNGMVDILWFNDILLIVVVCLFVCSVLFDNRSKSSYGVEIVFIKLCTRLITHNPKSLELPAIDDDCHSHDESTMQQRRREG